MEEIIDGHQSPAEATGYLHRDYAQALDEFGSPRFLKRSRGWILERQIPGSPYIDAMGCYPLFVCQNWSNLHIDLEDLKDDLISLSVVTDPFGDYDVNYLRQCFKDVVVTFKEHFVVDLSCPIETFVSRHHLRNAQKALRNIRAEKCVSPDRYIDEWVNLYNGLRKRHDIKGIHTFSIPSFTKQLDVPGLVMFCALDKEKIVGMVLWYIQGNVGYYHLGAYNSSGYELGASFALFWFAINYFADYGLKWLNLGSGAGTKVNRLDGLTRFKSGWATGTRTAYFCGRIFDYTGYTEIVKTKKMTTTGYFPSYRAGEFG